MKEHEVNVNVLMMIPMQAIDNKQLTVAFE